MFDATNNCLTRSLGRHSQHFAELSQLARRFLGGYAYRRPSTVCDRCCDSAWIDDRDTNRRASQLIAERLGEPTHSKLAGRVGGLPWWCYQPEDTRDVHNASVIASLKH